MSNVEAVFRVYTDSDYEKCESLVNNAWQFDKNFSPQELAEFAKYSYTMGSVRGSNYRQVVEQNGVVVGFIFGLNEAAEKPKIGILYALGILWRLLRIKSMAFKDKKKFFNAINVHEINRLKVVNRGKSEIILFVVDNNYQGRGYGKKLLSGFTTYCKSKAVTSVIVETNKLGASSFYEKMGFIHIGDFNSPLHEYATKGGQACMYEYTFE